MAHQEHMRFFESVKALFPGGFVGKRILDVGSLDINGNNRALFNGCEYIGLDIGPGKNVDVVSVAHEYQCQDASFDTVVSSNCLEHDMFYEKTLAKMLSVLRPTGLMLFVCKGAFAPGEERVGEHGTVLSDTYSSPLTSRRPGWDSYYKNLFEEDVRRVLAPDKSFSRYFLGRGVKAGDLQFWGIKA